MQDLIKRLEAASGPDRELDHAITTALWPNEPLQWPDQYKASGDFWSRRAVPHFTNSIDAALTLVPKGRRGFVGFGGNNLSGTWVRGEASIDASHKYPAIALCIAALKAREPSP